MKKRSPKMSAGALALGKAGRTPAQLAQELESPLSTIKGILSGHRKPGLQLRLKIKGAYDIAPESWDAARARKPATATPPPGTTVAGLADLFIQQTYADLEALKADFYTDEERQKRRKACLADLAAAGQYTGESGAITKAKILKSPEWSKIRETMFTALDPWPDAARAVGKALIAMNDA